MLKKHRGLLALCLAGVLAAGALSIQLFAQPNVPTVTYDHGQKTFVFDNITPEHDPETDSDHLYPNLFTDLRELMPGDSRKQSIRVQVKNVPSGGTVNLYLKTALKNEDITPDQALDYEQLAAGLTVSCGEKLLDTQSLGQGVLLGKLSGSQGLDLTVSLDLGIELGNEWQGLRGEIAWIFTAEYFPPQPLTPVGPNPPALDKGDHYAYIIGKSDGLVHPEADITRAEVATIFFRMLTEESREEYWSQTNPYHDVRPDIWYNNAVSTLTRAGIVKGKPGNLFAPQDSITRGEFAAMAVRFFGGETDGTDHFTDIAGHWANHEINLAYARDLIRGYPDGTFRPDQPITRAEAMVIVNRVLERYPHREHLLPDMITWPDNLDTSAWYYADVQEATNSHAFSMSRDAESQPYEVWTALRPVRDWAALERVWSDSHGGGCPGEVVSSRDNAQFR